MDLEQKATLARQALKAADEEASAQELSYRLRLQEKKDMANEARALRAAMETQQQQYLRDRMVRSHHDMMNILTSNADTKLRRALLYHVLGAEVMSSDLSDGQTATTLFNQDITVTIDANGGVMINNANVAIADIQTLNGVVHVLDAVILPPNTTVADVVINSDVHETLEGAVVAADLAGALSNLEGTFTVFAPTDDAFALLGEDVINGLLEDTETLSDILAQVCMRAYLISRCHVKLGTVNIGIPLL